MKRLGWANGFILDLAAAGLAPVPLERLRSGAAAGAGPRCTPAAAEPAGDAGAPARSRGDLCLAGPREPGHVRHRRRVARSRPGALLNRPPAAASPGRGAASRQRPGGGPAGCVAGGDQQLGCAPNPDDPEPLAPAPVRRWPRWPARHRIGELRDGAPMQVLSGAIGRERLHFEAPPRDQLEEAAGGLPGLGRLPACAAGRTVAGGPWPPLVSHPPPL